MLAWLALSTGGACPGTLTSGTQGCCKRIPELPLRSGDARAVPQHRNTVPRRHTIILYTRPYALHMAPHTAPRGTHCVKVAGVFSRASRERMSGEMSPSSQPGSLPRSSSPIARCHAAAAVVSSSASSAAPPPAGTAAADGRRAAPTGTGAARRRSVMAAPGAPLAAWPVMATAPPRAAGPSGSDANTSTAATVEPPRRTRSRDASGGASSSDAARTDLERATARLLAQPCAPAWTAAATAGRVMGASATPEPRRTASPAASAAPPLSRLRRRAALVCPLVTAAIAGLFCPRAACRVPPGVVAAAQPRGDATGSRSVAAHAAASSPAAAAAAATVPEGPSSLRRRFPLRNFKSAFSAARFAGSLRRTNAPLLLDIRMLQPRMLPSSCPVSPRVASVARWPPVGGSRRAVPPCAASRTAPPPTSARQPAAAEASPCTPPALSAAASPPQCPSGVPLDTLKTSQSPESPSPRAPPSVRRGL